jgi:hypothetical protein
MHTIAKSRCAKQSKDGNSPVAWPEITQRHGADGARLEFPIWLWHGFSKAARFQGLQCLSQKETLA